MWMYFYFKNIFFCVKIVKGRVKFVLLKLFFDIFNMELMLNYDCYVFRNIVNLLVINFVVFLRSIQVGNDDKLFEICLEMEVIRWMLMLIRLIIRYNEI